MRIWVQKSASMQKRTSPLKFGDFAEKSELNSVSNLSTKDVTAETREKNAEDAASAWAAGSAARCAAGLRLSQLAVPLAVP